MPNLEIKSAQCDPWRKKINPRADIDHWMQDGTTRLNHIYRYVSIPIIRYLNRMYGNNPMFN